MLRSPWADAHGYLLSPHSRLLGNAANRLAERIGDRRVLSLLSGLLFGVYDRDNTTGDCPDFRGADGVALRARRTCAETLIHGAHALVLTHISIGSVQRIGRPVYGSFPRKRY